MQLQLFRKAGSRNTGPARTPVGRVIYRRDGRVNLIRNVGKVGERGGASLFCRDRGLLALLATGHW